MKNVLVGSVLALACTSALAASPAEDAASVRRDVARQLALDFANARTRQSVLESLVEHSGGVAATDLGVAGVAQKAKAGRASRSDAYGPHVRLHLPSSAVSKGMSFGAVAVAYVPAGDDKTWTTIEAFGPGGRVLQLDADTAPDFPVVIVGTDERRTKQEALARINRMLRDAGLQHGPAASLGIEPRDDDVVTKATASFMRLDRIRLANDQEPWISGDAEVYALVSGVVGDNTPQIAAVDMPYLNKDGTTYYPEQLVINWGSFQYSLANITLMEHDDNTNYRDLVTAILSAVGAVGSLAGYPVIQAVTEIANRIVAAMPDSWLTNDDDYVDSYYTFQKGIARYNRTGAAGNANGDFVPFTVTY